MIKYNPKNENSAVERIDFYKDNKKITLVNRFDDYVGYVDEEEDDFNIESYDENQGAMMMFVDSEEGERVEFDVEGDVSDQERDNIIAAFQESFESGVERLGWTWSDREVWFYGPVNREEDYE
jgi:hypothetical protein